MFFFSQSGKTTFIKNLLLEREVHFKETINQLIYIYREEDENIQVLKKHFKKNGTFLTNIPEDLEEILIPAKSICVIDDNEQNLTADKSKLKILKYLGDVGVHHKKLIVFVLLQTFGCFYKRHVLNSILYQATSLILFRSVSNFSSLKRWLNSYEITLKGNQTLYEVFKNFVQKERYAYLILNIAPSLETPKVYNQILLCDSRPMLIFHAGED